jgi:hypothetical protein
MERARAYARSAVVEDQPIEPQAGEEACNLRIEQNLVFAPKRPLSPFIYFSQEMRRKLKEENPKLHSDKIVKIAIKEWKKLPAEKKDHYHKISNESRRIYQEKKDEFDRLQLAKRAQTPNPETETVATPVVRARREIKVQEKADIAIVK